MEDDKFNPLAYRMTIVSLPNGYIIQKGVAGEDAEYGVIQNDGEGQDDITAGFDMLFEVMQYFNLIGSKHDKRRIRIEIEGVDENDPDGEEEQ